MNFHSAVPIFNVENISASRDYYQKVLGFKLHWEYENVVCSMIRGDCEVFLAEGDQGGGKAWVFVGVGDVDDLHEEFKKKGALIRQAPTNFPWGSEIQVEDMDGNVFRFGSDAKQDSSFGPWLDKDGKAWKIE